MEIGDFESMFEKLCSALKSEGKVESISEDFKKLKSDIERFDFLVKLKSVQEIIKLPENTPCGKKSLEKSQQLRTEGNKLFQKKNFLVALQRYTECVACSPWPINSENANQTNDCLSLAFANRSAVLVHLDEHQLAVNDVENAFKNGYPKELAYKLHERKARCLLAMGRKAESLISFDAATSALEESKLDDKKKRKWKTDLAKELAKCENNHTETEIAHPSLDALKWNSNLPDIADGMNSTFCSLSKACSVEFLPGRGRFIVALRDVSPGEVLLIEKPYASILLPDHYTDHCYHCFVRTLAPFPCSQCSLVMYCSEKCQTASQNAYHKFECTVLSALRAAGVDKFAYLALRTLAGTPLSQLIRYRKAVESGEYPAKDCTLLGSNQSGLYTPHEYHAICNLVTHAENRNTHDLFRRAIIAVFLLRCLQRSGYFGLLNTEEVTSDLSSYAGGLLLSHLQSFPCNAHEISEFGLDTGAVAESVPHELGAGIYATLSLFNHSCDPAASRNFYADVCVVRAIKGIRKGCEISDNYGAVYAIQPREERRQKLRAQYFFDCGCEACANDWPVLSEVKSKAPRWHCKSCGAPVPLSSTLSDSMATCTNCGTQQTLLEKISELAESDKTYRVAFNRLLKCEVAGALPSLLGHLATMDRLLCLPWMDYSCCQEAVKQCFSIMANCFVKDKQITHH